MKKIQSLKATAGKTLRFYDIKHQPANLLSTSPRSRNSEVMVCQRGSVK